MAVVLVSVYLFSGWTLYGAIAFSLVLLKVTSSLVHAPSPTISRPIEVGVLITSYNEDPRALWDCLTSITAQKPTVILVVDDCSEPPVTWSQLPPGVQLVTHDANAGKREALLTGWNAMSGDELDYVVTVDSDTVLEPGSIERLLAPMECDERVGGTTGLVSARNWNKNLLTRIQDVRYANAFLTDRAAYSTVGSVLCVCGSLAAWRADVFEENVARLVEQEFLGQPCTYGDDRHLTNLALSQGWRVELAPEALSSTLVPERFGHWIRQQTRWSKSFVRESGWALLYTSRAPFMLSFVELASWLVLTTVIMITMSRSVWLVATGGDVSTGLLVLGSYLLWVVLSSFARSARYLDVARPGMAFSDRATMLSLSPIYGLLHIFVLLPLRFYALATMRDASWGTRSEGVEVTA